MTVHVGKDGLNLWQFKESLKSSNNKSNKPIAISCTYLSLSNGKKNIWEKLHKVYTLSKIGREKYKNTTKTIEKKERRSYNIRYVVKSSLVNYETFFFDILWQWCVPPNNSRKHWREVMREQNHGSYSHIKWNEKQ